METDHKTNPMTNSMADLMANLMNDPMTDITLFYINVFVFVTYQCLCNVYINL